MDKPEVDPRRTIKAHKADFPLEDGVFPSHAAPGGIEKRCDGEYVLVSCPGCGSVSGMSIATPKPKQSPSWNIDAGSLDNPESLTLSPSINCTGCCGWHGYLRNGVFAPC